MFFDIVCSVQMALTLGLAYNEFGYREHPATTSKFLCIKIIDGKKGHLQRALTDMQ